MSVKAGVSPEAIAYLHGRIDKEIELFAASTIHCTATELAEELGSLLLYQRIRVEHNVSSLREAPAEGNKALATVEMVSGPHRKPQRSMSEATKRRLSELAKQRWAKLSKNQRTRLVNKLVKARQKGRE